MKILTVIGARPQFIKAAPVSFALAAAGINEIIVHTGQHYDSRMSDIFFDELGIRTPDYNLSIGSGLHGEQTGRMMEALERVLINEQPECVLVYGDTNSTLAGAITAAKLHIPVAHVESGLRSFNRKMPEEINRIVTDHLSALLFVPTELAKQNLANEGISGESVSLVGDVMLDAALLFRERASAASKIMANLKLETKGYVLATIHRAENTEDPARIQAILGGLSLVSREIKVVLPVHPRTQKRVDQGILTAFQEAGGILIEPVGYLDMIELERNAAVIATDSGGIQKEAFFFKVPCVILRDETEWTELVQLGWNTLAPLTGANEVAVAVLAAVGRRGSGGAPYGEGNASQAIANILRRWKL